METKEIWCRTEKSERKPIEIVETKKILCGDEKRSVKRKRRRVSNGDNGKNKAGQNHNGVWEPQKWHGSDWATSGWRTTETDLNQKLGESKEPLGEQGGHQRIRQGTKHKEDVSQKMKTKRTQVRRK